MEKLDHEPSSRTARKAQRLLSLGLPSDETAGRRGRIRSAAWPVEPDPAIDLAKGILGARFEADHKDLNAMAGRARCRARVRAHALRPGCSGCEVRCHGGGGMEPAHAPAARIHRRIGALSRKVSRSVAASVARVDPTTLGGRGAAGRQRDHSRAAEGRAILRGQIARLEAELTRRATGSSADDQQ
jgi:hypothetical protein